MADYPVKNYRKRNVDKSIADEIEAIESIESQAGIEAAGDIESTGGDVIAAGAVRSATIEPTGNVIVPDGQKVTTNEIESRDSGADALDVDAEQINLLGDDVRISPSGGALSVGLDKDATSDADKANSLRLLHVRSGGSMGTYIDFPETTPLQIRSRDTSLNVTPFHINKGYSAGSPGAVIAQRMYIGNQLPSTWVLENSRPAGWTSPTNIGTQWKSIDFVSSTWSALASFEASGTNRIICGFYYQPIAPARFPYLATRIHVQFKGPVILDGSATDTCYSLIGQRFQYDSAISRIEHSLNVFRRTSSSPNGGDLGYASGYIDVPIGYTDRVFICFAINKDGTDDYPQTWGYHSNVTITEVTR